MDGEEDEDPLLKGKCVVVGEGSGGRAKCGKNGGQGQNPGERV